MDIEQRLGRLERENKRLKVFGILMTARPLRAMVIMSDIRWVCASRSAADFIQRANQRLTRVPTAPAFLGLL